MTEETTGKSVINVVFTTDDEQEAWMISDELLNKRLISAVHVYPFRSRYWWKGELVSAEEWKVEAKTRVELYQEVEKRIKELHHYDTPEILAYPVERIHPRYKAWVEEETRQ